ncbi:hypothetical protein AC1031_013439 [Aphanomyces cochlioides]|nr:hypothetical protein AC1031_013439 [Aphanomyces cochlioides]
MHLTRSDHLAIVPVCSLCRTEHTLQFLMSFTCLSLSIATLNWGGYKPARLLEDDEAVASPPASMIENHAASTSMMVSVKSEATQYKLDRDDNGNDVWIAVGHASPA